jgi:hypothetical protein
MDADTLQTLEEIRKILQSSAAKTVARAVSMTALRI